MNNFQPRLTTFFYSKWYWVAMVYSMDQGFRTVFGGGIIPNATLLAGPYSTKLAARNCLRRVRRYTYSWTERGARNPVWKRELLDEAICRNCNDRFFMHHSGLERHRAANPACRIFEMHEQ